MGFAKFVGGIALNLHKGLAHREHGCGRGDDVHDQGDGCGCGCGRVRD